MELFVSEISFSLLLLPPSLSFSVQFSHTRCRTHAPCRRLRVSGSILTLIGCFSSGWQTPSMWGCGSGQIQSTSALYDLIHCQVRWHLAKVALAISIWSNKSIRWPCCAGLCYTLRGPRSIFISFGRWQNRLLAPQAEIYFATLTLPPSVICKRSFRWVSKCESIVFCYYLRYEYEQWPQG